MNDLPVICWIESGESWSALWRSESGVLPPKRVVIADDSISADVAYRFACEGTAMLWHGDFNNARQLLQALSRRLERKPRLAERKARKPMPSLAEAFYLHRQSQAQRARILGMLLVPLENDYRVPLPRAPDVQQACIEAYGPGEQASVVSLRELLGLIGAHEWRVKEISNPKPYAGNAPIHPEQALRILQV